MYYAILVEFIFCMYSYKCVYAYVHLFRACWFLLLGFLRAASNIGNTPIEKVVSGVRLNTIVCRTCHMVKGHIHSYKCGSFIFSVYACI